MKKIQKWRPVPMKISPRTLWTWIVISFVVFLAACWLSTGWQPPQSRTRTAVLTASDIGDSKEVTARGWVESNHVSYGERIPFWITIVNASDHEIQDLRLLSLHTPGFKPARSSAPGAKPASSCWTSTNPPMPSCIEGAPSLPATLKSGGAVTLWAELEATSPAGRYGLSAVFGWKNPGGERARKALLLGPVEVTYPLADSLFPITEKAYGAGKDFGLPFAVAVLTFLLGVREQKNKKDEELAEQKRKRDEALAEQRRKEDLDFAEKRHKEEQELAEQKLRERQKLDDERRAQIQQTWSLLLQKHLKDSQLHYLPISSKLTYLRSRALRQPPELRECFYWLMAFMRRIKYTADGIGGIHLKSRLAEETFTSAWATFRDVVEELLGKTKRSRALNLMRTNESMAEFEERFAAGSDPLFTDLEQEFARWLSDTNEPFKNYLCLIWLMQLVLEFETNRPFRYWYDKSLEFPKKDLEDALEELRKLPAVLLSRYQVKENLEGYLKDGPEAIER
jgi:hypothetical protein